MHGNFILEGIQLLTFEKLESIVVPSAGEFKPYHDVITAYTSNDSKSTRKIVIIRNMITLNQ